ncbi:MAG: nitroreductase family protein [Bacteroidota bacterium]
MNERVSEYLDFMKTRRSVREFSSRPVPLEVIENIIRIAGTAPSGANKQPWTFCVISNPELKKKIRESAEAEEFISYNGRMGEEWLKDLEPFGTNHVKEFIEVCPYIIVVFRKAYDIDQNGVKHNNYYVNESVGIAVGFLLSAIHQAGLVSLTHTPSPMNFLHELLERPENERPYLLIPVGFPADDARVPNLLRKPLDEVSAFYH